MVLGVRADVVTAIPSFQVPDVPVVGVAVMIPPPLNVPAPALTIEPEALTWNRADAEVAPFERKSMMLPAKPVSRLPPRYVPPADHVVTAVGGVVLWKKT